MQQQSLILIRVNVRVFNFGCNL